MRIIVASNELESFATQWPCCEFPEGMGVVFDFDSRGDLDDIEWYNAWSGKPMCAPELTEETYRAFVAVSQDAQVGKIGTRLGA